MSETNMWLLSALGLITIVVLVIVIKKQLSNLNQPTVASSPEQTKSAEPGKNHKSANANNAVNIVEPSSAEPEARTKSTKLDAKESIAVIATLTLDDQVELSEASIRLKILLDHYDSNMHEKDDFRIFNEVYAALKHMPTHQARKNTDKRFLHKLDQERFAIEAKHRDAIRAGAQALLKHLDSPELNLVKKT